MFAPLGLFKDIPCPEGQDCSLLTCIFSHNSHTSIGDGPNIAANGKDVPETKSDIAAMFGNSALTTSAAPDTGERGTKLLKREFKPGLPKATDLEPSAPLISSKVPQPPAPSKPVRLQSLSRTVSPPPKPASASAKTATPTPTRAPAVKSRPPRQAPRESLNPRMLTKAPAPHGARLAILTKLHASMASQNEKLAKDTDSRDKYLVLTPNELITMALDEEEKTAKGNPSIYANVIKLRIVRLMKMSKEEWTTEVKNHLNERYYKIEAKAEQSKPQTLNTGLSAKEEIALASQLVTPVEGLEQYGYVTKAPSDAEVENAKKGVAESKGWEKCDRCGGRFQVFPGRREDGSLTSGGECIHHPGKPFYPPRKQTDHITGHKEAYYSCCNETLGTSSGCTRGKTHVYKVSETKRLASVLQFTQTPVQPFKGPLQPVCFDCEMGYTTLGLELIRLTAVSWPQGKALLDVLVRPMGEVLDLNSQFSGVFPEHYNKAIPYNSFQEGPGSAAHEDGEVEEPALRVVESPAAARALLFRHLQPDTPLIGHAIDNDLNVCRIIHPTIIDTVMLYPHPRGLPNRMSLKTLCRRHLEREIQTGGSLGHDSKEDAIATGDLVRVKAAETWKVLKSKGWQIQGDKLVPPPGTEGAEAGAAAGRLGPGAGQKRANSSPGR
ncbi:putative RNA exonuclease Rex3 [Aspergillus homomorphus CBS 101889]|uniref:RNA exonuclease 3 n=1 Tax=Aspergillus homomorphus (strain CBS 101889) TaxID=1450537 RepID=A0A395I7V5_ASPHC|nr:RNA exonuclease Rex3 [Aspergillus homomorphus CBS 101889]RAL15333.1 RNA exonuclease Rex3 [Aspergillus homomorphus CBS 101889]